MKTILLALVLSGCGYPDSLEGFSLAETWNCGDKVIESERPLDHAKVCRNIALAEDLIRTHNTTNYRLSYYGTMKVRVWNRQILMCDQKFLGACVHFLKGLEESEAKGPVVNVNNGGELLLHEFLHVMNPGNPNHVEWCAFGWCALDYQFRREAEMLTERMPSDG